LCSGHARAGPAGSTQAAAQRAASARACMQFIAICTGITCDSCCHCTC
jgi:hypothetical protein